MAKKNPWGDDILNQHIFLFWPKLVCASECYLAFRRSTRLEGSMHHDNLVHRLSEMVVKINSDKWNPSTKYSTWKFLEVLGWHCDAIISINEFEYVITKVLALCTAGCHFCLLILINWKGFFGWHQIFSKFSLHNPLSLKYHVKVTSKIPIPHYSSIRYLISIYTISSSLLRVLFYMFYVSRKAHGNEHACACFGDVYQ